MINTRVAVDRFDRIIHFNWDIRTICVEQEIVDRPKSQQRLPFSFAIVLHIHCNRACPIFHCPCTILNDFGGLSRVIVIGGSFDRPYSVHRPSSVVCVNFNTVNLVETGDRWLTRKFKFFFLLNASVLLICLQTVNSTYLLAITSRLSRTRHTDIVRNKRTVCTPHELLLIS